MPLGLRFERNPVWYVKIHSHVNLSFRFFSIWMISTKALADFLLSVFVFFFFPFIRINSFFSNRIRRGLRFFFYWLCLPVCVFFFFFFFFDFVLNSMERRTKCQKKNNNNNINNRSHIALYIFAEVHIQTWLSRSQTNHYEMVTQNVWSKCWWWATQKGEQRTRGENTMLFLWNIYFNGKIENWTFSKCILFPENWKRKKRRKRGMCNVQCALICVHIEQQYKTACEELMTFWLWIQLLLLLLLSNKINLEQ